MANTITGRIKHIAQTQQIASKDGQSTFLKRELYLDCTRHDPWTGEANHENIILLEFSGDKCSLLDDFSKDDIVTVSFAVQGIRYKKNGQDAIFTSIRPYKIEKRQPVNRPRDEQQMPPQAQPQYITKSNGGGDGLPF